MKFSLGSMLVLALIVWQALGLPEVEDPMPDRIGLGFVVGLAGAFGVLAGILSAIVRPRERERLIAIGTFIGFWLGAALYALSLFVQVVFGS